MLEWILKSSFHLCSWVLSHVSGQHLLERRAIHSAHMAASAPSFPLWTDRPRLNLWPTESSYPVLKQGTFTNIKLHDTFYNLWLKRLKYLLWRIGWIFMQYVFILSTCILTKCLSKCNCIWLRRKDMTFITYYRSLAIYSVSELKTKNILPQHHSVICFLLGSLSDVFLHIYRMSLIFKKYIWIYFLVYHFLCTNVHTWLFLSPFKLFFFFLTLSVPVLPKGFWQYWGILAYSHV